MSPSHADMAFQGTNAKGIVFWPAECYIWSARHVYSCSWVRTYPGFRDRCWCINLLVTEVMNLSAGIWCPDDANGILAQGKEPDMHFRYIRISSDTGCITRVVYVCWTSYKLVLFFSVTLLRISSATVFTRFAEKDLGIFTDDGPFHSCFERHENKGECIACDRIRSPPTRSCGSTYGPTSKCLKDS